MNRWLKDGDLIRKNPIVIVFGLIIFQVIATALFFSLASLADYGEIYAGISLSKIISFGILEFSAMVLLEIVLVFYIFFQWSFETFEIKREGIVHLRGILFKSKSVIPIDTGAIVKFKQGPISRIAKYGTIIIESNSRRHVIRFISNPESFSNQIRSIVGLHANGHAKTNGAMVDEGINLEMKSTLRWDTRENKVNKNLEKAVMKTIVGFMNTDGGRLMIGVDDGGEPLGLDHDYGSLIKKNSDGFENHFNNLFSEMIGPEYRNYVRVQFQKSNDKEVAAIDIAPSSRPVYLKNGEEEHFYIRTGNATTALKVSEATNYINSWWDNYEA